MRSNLNMRDRVRIPMMLIINVILILIIVLVFVFYNNSYEEKLNTENLNNIKNLNQSAATIAASYFVTRCENLANIVRYAETSKFNLNETLEYIAQSTDQSYTSSIQLVATDYKGVIAQKDTDGSFISISYEHGDYADLWPIFSEPKHDGKINFTPEFTDRLTAIKSFAFYTYLTLIDEGEEAIDYTIMWLSYSDDVVDIINLDGGYDQMSTVLTDAKGNYILSNSDFKATNFFDYLYNYNDFSLEQRNSVKREVAENGQGELYYKNSRDSDCVFRYTQIEQNEWICITAVPLSSFHSTASNFTFILLITIAIFIMIIADVTWLSTLNRKLRISMDKEKQANAAKSEFLSRISHDIRTPLNGIIGSTGLAMDENNPPNTAEYLKIIDSSGRFLLGLVNDVLDMSKVESGKITLHPEPYHLSELHDYLHAVIMPLANDKGVDFKISMSDDNTSLMLDHLRFNQICFNLLSNAIKFTRPGGTVEFILDQTISDTQTVILDVTVRDSGIGMSREFQEHMFESFSQEKREFISTPGTGLGLAIVKNLVNLMDAEIDVESRIGEGSTFHIRLEALLSPILNAKAKPSDTSDKLDEVLRGKRVLLCEDNEINAIIATRLLKKKDMEVDLAENGSIGVDMFVTSASGYYDAILMDVMMPVLDGLEATRRIRSSNHEDAADIPIIAMTANAYLTDIENCVAAGMNTHVAKPVNPTLLFTALIRCMELKDR